MTIDMTRMNLSVVVLASAALLLAGCGGSSSQGVAHLSSSTSGSSAADGAGKSSTPESSASTQQKMVKFSQCMRHHGLSNFPDVIPDQGLPIQHEANGSVAILVNSVPQPISGPALNKALGGCHQYAQNFMGNAVTGGTANDLQTAMVKTAACMRRYGVPNYPDPRFSAGGVTQGYDARDGVDPNSPIFQAAQKACQSNKGPS